MYQQNGRDMITFNDIKGMKVVGYRYGKAPESGRSYNFRDHFFEDGISMAQVLYCKPVGSFAAHGDKRYYYSGTVSGIGSDGEICITNAKPVSYKEYLSLRKTLVTESNAITNYRADHLIDLINRGFTIGYSEEEIEAQRKKYTKR